MKTNIVRAICMAVIVFGVYSIVTNTMGISSLLAQEPNNISMTPPVLPVVEPNKPRRIVMPRNTKLPPRFKCPVHGIVDKALLNIEINGVINTYCKKCAMQFVVDVFDLNLPKLEQIIVVQEEMKKE